MNRKAYWLGFFFFVVLLTIGFATVMVNNIHFGRKAFDYKVSFESVEGLKTGDDVRVEGVTLGKVFRVHLRGRGGVVVTIRLEEELTLGSDGQIFVESFSLLGGNFISIRRGKDLDHPKDTKQELYGTVRPNAFEQLGAAVQENRDSLKQVLGNIRDTFAETKVLVAKINAGEGTIGKLAHDTALYDDARKALEKIDGASKEFRELAAKLNTGDGSIAKLVNSSELHDRISKSMEDIQKTAAEVRSAAEKLNSNEGIAGRILHDKKMADDFKEAVEKLKAITQNLEQITGKVARGEGTVGQLIQDDKVVTDIKRQLDNVERTLGRAAHATVYLGGDTRHFMDTDVDISHLFFRFEPDKKKYFQVGASFMALPANGDTVTFQKQIDKGEDDTVIKIDFQAMYKIPWFFDDHVGIRAGLMEGKPGGALDVDFDLFDHEFRLSAEVRDAYGSIEDEKIDENIHGPMSSLTLRTPLWNREPKEWYEQILYAMKAFGGVSRLQDKPEFFAGIGLEYTDDDIRTLVGLVSTAK